MMQIGALLDAHPEIEAMVEQDLVTEGASRDVGRVGLSGDQVLRALVVKQMNQFSYGRTKQSRRAPRRCCCLAVPLTRRQHDRRCRKIASASPHGHLNG
jgi:hypothetical protein